MEGLSKEYQQQSESKFSNNFCPRTEYNHFRKATVLLYRQTLGQTKFLFYSKGIDDSCLEVPQGEFRGVDSAITFTAVRAILEETYGLLSDSTFNKLAQNQKITKEDLFNPKVVQFLYAFCFLVYVHRVSHNLNFGKAHILQNG